MTEPPYAKAFLARYDSLDRTLVAAGFPATSPWWREQIERVVRSGKRRWLIRAGRRAGKSSTLCRLATAWALWGAYKVPPGDTAVIPFVSVDRKEAGRRLTTIASILDVLKVKYEQTSESITLPEKRVVFDVMTCSITSVGYTSIMAVGDEVARWESKDTSANPARDVIGSIAPTLATQRYGLMVLSSSPWGTDDFHYEQCELGDTDHQTYSFAPSWIGNPSLGSEEDTRPLASDEKEWLREYAAVPGSIESNAFESAWVENAFKPFRPDPRGPAFILLDPSGLKHDTFAWALARQLPHEIQIQEIGGWGRESSGAIDVVGVCQEIAKKAKQFGARVYTDNGDAAHVEANLTRASVECVAYRWNRESKHAAGNTLAKMLSGNKLRIVPNERMRRELSNQKARLLPSEQYDYPTNGRDAISLLFTLAHAINDPTQLIKTPLAPAQMTMQDVPASAWDALGDLMTNDLQNGMSGAQRYWASRR